MTSRTGRRPRGLEQPCCPASGQLLLEPLEYRLWATLKLQVAVPPCRSAADPLEPLVGNRDVVEHRLHIARFGQHVVMHLIKERRYADVSRPFLRCARPKS